MADVADESKVEGWEPFREEYVRVRVSEDLTLYVHRVVSHMYDLYLEKDNGEVAKEKLCVLADSDEAAKKSAVMWAMEVSDGFIKESLDVKNKCVRLLLDSVGVEV